jgi:type III restriction enzyme
LRRELGERTGNCADAKKLADRGLLREVMSSVGMPARLGGSIGCVVSVSSLTEGRDANTIHTSSACTPSVPLLCSEALGRALRRQVPRLTSATWSISYVLQYRCI